MARKKKIEEEITEPVAAVKLPKAKFKIGDTVTVSFLGQLKQATIIEIKQHPVHPRWVYKVKDDTNTIIPWVGTNNSEKFANIID